MKVQTSLALANSHLSGYLNALRSSTDMHIRVKSRWPWVTEVVAPYPNSLLDRLVLFIKTLYICIPEEAKNQFLMRSIQSLNLYKNAISYQLLACKPTCLNHEKEILSNKGLSHQLEKLKYTLLGKKEIALDQKDSLREWGGRLVDSRAEVRLDPILDFRKSSGILLKAVQSIRNDIRERKKKLPFLIKQAINEQKIFFERDPLLIDKKRLEPPKKIQLLSYFVSEFPRVETISLHKQVDMAARIWNSNSESCYYKPLAEFKRFFEDAIEQYGPAWDIANGVAYANLFKGI